MGEAVAGEKKCLSRGNARSVLWAREPSASSPLTMREFLREENVLLRAKFASVRSFDVRE